MRCVSAAYVVEFLFSQCQQLAHIKVCRAHIAVSIVMILNFNIQHMNHGREFQKLWAQLRSEVSALQARGYFGDGANVSNSINYSMQLMRHRLLVKRK